MNWQRLTEEVTAEVKRRLAETADKIAIGGQAAGYRPYDNACSAKSAQCALLVTLAPWRMVNLAQGAAADGEERFILQMLLLGKPVAAKESGLLYRQYQDGAPSGLYRQYLAAEKALRQMGIVFVGESLRGEGQATRKPLLDERRVRLLLAAGEKTIVLTRGTIVTPLARDVLDKSGAKVIWEA